MVRGPIFLALDDNGGSALHDNRAKESLISSVEQHRTGHAVAYQTELFDLCAGRHTAQIRNESRRAVQRLARDLGIAQTLAPKGKCIGGRHSRGLVGNKPYPRVGEQCRQLPRRIGGNAPWSGFLDKPFSDSHGGRTLAPVRIPRNSTSCSPNRSGDHAHDQPAPAGAAPVGTHNITPPGPREVAYSWAIARERVHDVNGLRDETPPKLCCSGVTVPKKSPGTTSPRLAAIIAGCLAWMPR